MKPPPRSIFTGSAAESDSIPPEFRRLSTPEYHEALNSGTEASEPSTPLEKPHARPPKTPTWIVKTPDDANTFPPPPPLGLRPEAARTTGTAEVETPSPIAGRKRRSVSIVYDDTATSFSTPLAPTRPEPSSEPLLKRRRVSRSRHTIDHFGVAKSAHLKGNSQPTSPLFFSHSQRARPHLPARFSSSEAAAKMLSKTRNEESGIKTVTLARGTYSGLSPSGTASRRSSERSSLPRTVSPDGRDRNDPLKLLGSVGVVELLEQDTRPTLVVDIGDSTNYAPTSSGLQILFANSALRSSPSTWELVAGRLLTPTSDEPTVHASNQFRGWLLSSVTPGENPDMNPPLVEHGGIVWSCYTLRKRLRVVSGTFASSAASSIPSTSTPHEFGIPSTSSLASSRMNVSTTPAHEPQDYFGTPVPPVAEDIELDVLPQSASLQTDSNQSQTQKDDVLAGPFSKPEKLDLLLLEGHPSFANECVLRAHAAGDIDAFHRVRSPSPPRDHDVGFFDWTRLSMSSSLPRHIQFARSIDWASTPLGPIENWSNDLRAMCNLIMSVQLLWLAFATLC
jgi:hypothetical protein